MGEWKEEYEPQRRYYEKRRLWFREFRRALRKEVVKAYGGECVCCGEKCWEFLTLDHPNGDGQADRAQHRNKTGSFYGWAKKNGFPGNYRLLCMNCNWIRRFGGICPHDPNYREPDCEPREPRKKKEVVEKPVRKPIEKFVPLLVPKKRTSLSVETTQKDEWIDP